MPVGESTVGYGLPRSVEGALAALGLLLSSPLVLGAMIAVRATSRGPAIFRQERVGRGGRSFTLLKLRSMRLAATTGTQITARGDDRITPVGRWLRRFKLDELPQLWNVVCGDMSLVGPRPEVPRYVDAEAPLWQQVLAARPGLTDPVTLALRDEESILAAAPGRPEDFYRRALLPYKLRGYAEYESRRTPWRDIGVLIATVLAIVGLRRTPPVTIDDITGQTPSS